jgi:TrmH family RNA methyltransferase
MLRLCDWFGVDQVVCTSDCVDVYNEKVVQASMGSVATIPCFYFEVDDVVKRAKNAGFTLTATSMDGPSVYEIGFAQKTALVIGNEGQGISPNLMEACQKQVSIPAAKGAKAESLNAAMATAVLFSEYFRLKN